MNAETKDYLNGEYYEYLDIRTAYRSVVSEKIYLPSIIDLIDQYSRSFNDPFVVRLLYW